MAGNLACGNCGAAMHALRLTGHYGTAVEIDLCAPCHLVWFDVVESARLAGPGLLVLVGEMASAQALAHLHLRRDLACPRCRAPVHTVHNQTRWGRSLQLECQQRHGAYQSFAQFLSEKGLLREMSGADRARAAQRDGALHCVNCGGVVGSGDAVCPWCTAQPAVVDVARLAQALDPEGATRDQAVHRTATRAAALACQACGAPQAEAAWQCTQCGATLTTPSLAEAHAAVLALAPALRAHALKPAAHVVKQRLAAQEPAMQRQRERTAAMQAEADAALGHTIEPAGAPWWQERYPAWWLAAALLLWLGWWFG
jgi:hypothetical protein